MSTIKNYFWIILALCLTAGSCEEVYKKSGESVMLTCNAEQNADIEWKHKDIRILSKIGKSGRLTENRQSHLVKKARLNGNNLVIPSLNKDDSGSYMCNGQQHQLHIGSAFASPPHVLVGSDTTLQCDITGGSNNQFQWLTPTNKIHNRQGQMATLKSVTTDVAGRWTCQIKNQNAVEVLKLEVDISVTGPLMTSDTISVAPGGATVLPCFLPSSSRLPITKVQWTRNSPTVLNFPTLDRTNLQNLKWNGTNVIKSKITFSDQPLSTDFNVTLKNVEHKEAGMYECTLTFENGKSLSAKMKLIVEGERVIKTPVSSGVLQKPVLGINLWIWIAVGVSSVVLIGLVVIIVLRYRRNKRMKRKVKKSLRQSRAARNYCQCNRPVNQLQPGRGKKARPPPLPRQQYDALHDYEHA